jgi:hypothetical protein
MFLSPLLTVLNRNAVVYRLCVDVGVSYSSILSSVWVSNVNKLVGEIMSSLRNDFKIILNNLDSKLSVATIKQSHELAWEAKENAVDALIQAVEADRAEAYKKGYIDGGLAEMRNK